MLEKIKNPHDLKRLSYGELNKLAKEIRQTLVSTVTANGGHLASNLGVVELTLALHRIFDSPRDKIIWDVGHQSYVHKLLTGRQEGFSTLRKYRGISGFTCRHESPHDPFGAGHASTSVSAGLGMVVARDLSRDDFNVVAVIGDGAIGGGMAFEAINHAGQLGSRLIVVLNDNGMAISPTVGALVRILNRVRFDPRYQMAKKEGEQLLDALPMGGLMVEVGRQVRSGVKGLVMKSLVWEELGFTYIGPVNGHSIKDVETALVRARDTKTRPVLVHVITSKGKGYEPAECDAVYFHGIPPGDTKPGPVSLPPTYSEVFSRTMLRLMKDDRRLVVITPAMPEGNCLGIVQKEFPKRVFDVGICEQHAVTFAAGLAAQGYVPVVAIYSTFLQRGFDQIIHDVCLQELPVVFAIDRSGIVGDDGKTHQGIFDLSYLGLIPNMVVAAPKDENELQHLLYTAVQSGKTMAVRYPRRRGLGVELDQNFKQLIIGKGEVMHHGDDVLIIALGSMVSPALEAARRLAEKQIGITVVNARFAKPLDAEIISNLGNSIRRVITTEENTLCGGFGSSVNRLFQDVKPGEVKLKNMGIPDEFVEQGSQDVLLARYGLDAEGIVRQVLDSFPELSPCEEKANITPGQ